MTYREYSAHLKVCEYLGREPAGKFKEIHDHITRIWSGMEVTVDEQNWTVLQKEGEWYFALDRKKGLLWCHHDRVWSFFQFDMEMRHSEIQAFVKSMAEEHFRSEAGTPHGRWNHLSRCR